MGRLFEIVIYTASLSLYADPLLDELDPNHIASYRLFRDHCTFHNNTFVKDLSVLGRNLKDIIIVDNSPASYAFQPENAIPISTWIDDTSDNKLSQLAPILELLANVDDVREYMKKVNQDNNSDTLQAPIAAAHAQTNTENENEKKPLVNTWITNPPEIKNKPKELAQKSSNLSNLQQLKSIFE